MGFDFVSFFPRAVMQGIPLLFGSTGEILTEKSGNLNLGIPGIMYVGGISGVIGAFFYEQAAGGQLNGFLAIMIPILCSLLGSLLMGLLYCFLTVTLRANQNVTGLAMTTFGVGVGNFFGGSLIKLTNSEVPSIALANTSLYFKTTLPGADSTGWFGELFLSYGFLAYVAIIIALGCIGNMVQSNSISNAMHTAFDVPLIVTGIVTAVLSGAVFFGGVGRLASVTEKIVPFMAAIYIIGGTYVIACHASELGNAFRLILVAAFDPQAVMGGAIGLTVAKAMQFGVARGLFSNEAGMGSTPHAHAVAKVEHPAEQGLVAIFGVFATLIVVTFTGIVILVTGVLDFQTTGIALTQKAYNVGLGSVGVGFVAVCLFFFAFSTIIGWYFFGEQNVKYLFGVKAVKVYACIAVVCVALGAVLEAPLVWNLSDLFNALMVFPNLLALLALSGVVAGIARNKKD